MFKKKPKRLADTSRKERPVFDNATDDVTDTGSFISELSMELQRKKLMRKGR